MKEEPYWKQCVARAAKAARYGNAELAYKWLARAKIAKGNEKDG